MQKKRSTSPLEWQHLGISDDPESIGLVLRAWLRGMSVRGMSYTMLGFEALVRAATGLRAAAVAAVRQQRAYASLGIGICVRKTSGILMTICRTSLVISLLEMMHH